MPAYRSRVRLESSDSSSVKSTLVKTSGRPRLADFWKDDVGARRRNDQDEDGDLHARAKSIISRKKTSAAYKVKYTIMSKDSRHYLELVINRILHCWRRKRQIIQMKMFFKWVNMTNSIHGSAANQVLQTQIMFERKLRGSRGGGGEFDDKMTKEQAEKMMERRWEERMEAERERKMRNMQKFVKMWQYKAIFPCFVNWKGWVREIVTERSLQMAKLKGFVLKMQGNVMGDCIHTWLLFSRQRAKLRKTLIRFLGGKEARQMSAALRIWRSRAQQLSVELIEFEKSGIEELREQILLLQAELDITQRNMGELQKQKQITGKKNMKKIVGMWRNKLKLGAFASWRNNAMTLRGQRKLLQSTILRMLNVKLSSAITRWTEVVGNMARREALGRKVLLRLLKIKLSAGFGTWKNKISRLKSVENKAMRASTDTIYEMEDTITQLQEELEAMKSTERQNEKLLARLENIESQNALLIGQLGEAAKKKAELAQKSAKKIIQNLVSKALASTLRGWIQYAKEAKSDRLKMKRFLIKIQRGGMFKHFMEWRKFVSDKKKNANIIKKFGARMQNATSVRIIQGWGKYVKDRRKYKQTLARFTRRMRNAKALGAWMSWLEYVKSRRRLKYLANRIMNRLENGKVFGGK